MKVGDTVMVTRGNQRGMIGKIKSKDHSYRNFGIKKYGLRFNILQENGVIISVDANDVKLYKGKVTVGKSKLDKDKQPNDATTQGK